MRGRPLAFLNWVLVWIAFGAASAFATEANSELLSPDDLGLANGLR
jgi:hypothetical protein